MDKKLHLETLAIHGGMEKDAASGAIVPPVQRSTIFEHGKGGMPETDFSYTRQGNPNRRQLEKQLTILEQGEDCATFASGVAATAAVFQALKPDDHVLLPNDVYHGTRKLVTHFMKKWGLNYSLVDMSRPERVEQNIQPETRLIWLESPSNPLLLITDISAIVKIVKERNIVVCVDNTWPTPVNQQPLNLGADLVVHSTTKYFGGHSDILGGAVVAGEHSNIFPKIREIQVMTGAVPSPDDCWLLSRSIRSLPYRMKGHNEHAMQIARFLSDHHNVDDVFYPGLESNPGHEVAARQMKAFGGMISFTVKGRATEALKVVAGSQIVTRATSLGGVESTWEHRLSSEGENSATPENLIRLSVGLEHPDDIQADIAGALDNI